MQGINQDEIQNKSIIDLMNTKVSWQVFISVVGIITLVMGWLVVDVTRAKDMVDENANRVSSVEGDIKSINTSIGNINKTLDRISDKLNVGQ